MTFTASDLAVELLSVTDGEAPIPVEALLRICEREGLATSECPECHEFEPYHTPDCPNGVCPICDRRGCVCDSAYERSAGK